jgi:hypothetical protein
VFGKRRTGFDRRFGDEDPPDRKMSDRKKASLLFLFGGLVSGCRSKHQALLDRQGEAKRARTGKKGKKSLFAFFARSCPFCFLAVFFAASLNQQKFLTSGLVAERSVEVICQAPFIAQWLPCRV